MAWDKARMRMERAARFELCMVYSDAEIAQMIGITPGGYAQMKMRPEYVDIRNSIKHGILQECDALIYDDIETLHDRVAQQVPGALQTIFDACQQRRDMKLAVSAAKDIIEIDNRLTAAKKIDVTVKKQDTEDDAVVKSMMEAMKPPTITTETIQ